MASIIESDETRLENGRTGLRLTIETAQPKNFHEAITQTASMDRLNMIGRLFLPAGEGPFPAVIITPGSLGLQDSHLEKAAHLTEAGVAACAIDPFHARQVVTTVSDQMQYSFAASAWDVLETVKLLAGRPEIDPTRIGAQGHSRGGSAVLSAACLRLSDAIDAPKLRGVYACYPWSGQQFLNPEMGGVRIRAVIGDQDDWCLPQQVQSHIQAMRLTGADASLRIFGGAHHSFDRASPVEFLEDAVIMPSAPTVYIADDGSFLHPLEAEPNPSLCDVDLFGYGLEAGYGRQGAHIGGGETYRDAFFNDMMDFWRSTMSV